MTNWSKTKESSVKSSLKSTRPCLYLHAVDAQRLLEAVHTLLQLSVVEVQQGFGAHGPGAAFARQLPGSVVELLLLQDVPQEAVQAGGLLLLQLLTHDLLGLWTDRTGLGHVSGIGIRL